MVVPGGGHKERVVGRSGGDIVSKVGNRRVGRPGASDNTWSSSVVIFRSIFRCREWRVESTVAPLDEVAEGGAVL